MGLNVSRLCFVVAIIFGTMEIAVSFQPQPSFFQGSSGRTTHQIHHSSVGGGASPNRSDDEDFGEFDKFLDPNYKESENLARAREFLSENSLPISFDSEQNEETEILTPSLRTSTDTNNTRLTEDSTSSALVGPSQGGTMIQEGYTSEMLANNPYMAVVSKLSPNELISRFTTTAHPRVQSAVRQTVLGLIGGLPKMAFDTTTVMSGQRLASLMFQLQMTGYLFKNADYRLSLSETLLNTGSDQLLISGEDVDEGKPKTLKGKIRGKLRLRFGSLFNRPGGKRDDTDSVVDEEEGIEVDADAYVSELRQEVEQLRSELMVSRKEKEETLRKDLLLYIRTLPEKELRDLTNTMSQDVLVAMKGLVNAVITGIGEGQIGPDTVTEQSGEAMAQLCMWQLAIGYNLRTLEVREEMKRSLAAGPSGSGDDSSAHGAFE
jgi:hypothetical protein